jgi:hypothetical protein
LIFKPRSRFICQERLAVAARVVDRVVRVR